MPLFFLLMIALYLLGNGYVYLRGWEILHALPLFWKCLLSACYWAGTCSFFCLFGHRDLPAFNPFLHLLYYIGTGWLVFTLYMVLLLLSADLLRVFNICFSHRFAACFGLTVLLLAGGYVRYSHPVKKVIDLHIDKEAPGMKQLRIAAVSDIHLGYGTTGRRLRQYVRMIREERPDLILIAGDLIDGSLKPVAEQHMEEVLRGLQAPLGVFMVPGNHEYYGGVEECRAFIRQRTSIRWLQDSVAALPGGIRLIGRDDRQNPRRKELSRLADTLPAGHPLLLLDHQPYHLEESARAGIDLQFSGHTHDGQVWPLNLITARLFEVSHGYRRKGNTHIYVSSGLSLWGPPFRIGTRGEMVVFNLTFR